MEKLPVAKNLPVMVRTVRKEPWVEEEGEGPREETPLPRSQI